MGVHGKKKGVPEPTKEKRRGGGGIYNTGTQKKKKKICELRKKRENELRIIWGKATGKTVGKKIHMKISNQKGG